MRHTIKNEEIQNYNNCISEVFPKYTSQLINWANQNAQGTRPRIVGQMSELFPEFEDSADEISVENWEKWYTSKYPDAISNAADKIFAQMENLKKAIQLIDRNMIGEWVRDLVIAKTYNGLYVQRAILEALAKERKQAFRLAKPSEEAVGIDGFVGDTAYSIKPESYKTMNRLSESIGVKFIYYVKTKTGLSFEVED
ncbi:MAG: MjaI family restriction endonuclease [Oscillospiraceae bacterium]